MRLLQDFQPDETRLFLGKYHYLRSGAPTGQVESWQITRLPDGTELIRADIDGRNIPGAPNLLALYQRRPDGLPKMLRIRYDKSGLSAAAQYDFEDAEVKITRQTDGLPRQQNVLEIAENYVVDYHPVIAHDYVWRGYPAQAEGETWSIPVFSPDLWAQGMDALSGRALRFTVTPMLSETCEVPAGVFEAPLRFRVVLPDGIEAIAWYDEFGIPLRWLYPQRGYDFVLIEYTRSQAED